MTIYFSFLAQRIPMDRGAWWATVHGVTESDMTEATQHTARTNALLGLLSLLGIYASYLSTVILVVLGLCCFARDFSSCSKKGLFFIAGTGLLIEVASLFVEHRLQAHGFQELQHTGLVAPQHAESSQTRDRTCVPCIGRQILIHYTTREAQNLYFLT